MGGGGVVISLFYLFFFLFLFNTDQIKTVLEFRNYLYYQNQPLSAAQNYLPNLTSELQKREGIEDNSKIICFISQ